MKKWVQSILLMIAIVLCVPAQAVAEDWTPAQIPFDARTQARLQQRQFSHCVSEEINKLTPQNTDFRVLLEQVINFCNRHLIPIETLFSSHAAPEEFSRQYLAKLRRAAVKQWLPVMMRRFHRPS